MNMLAILNLVIFTALLSFLFQMSKRGMSLSRRTLLSLVVGSVFGFYLQMVFGSSEVVPQTLEWTNMVADSYVNLLRMIIMPLVLITMLAAVMKVDEIKSCLLYTSDAADE